MAMNRTIWLIVGLVLVLVLFGTKLEKEAISPTSQVSQLQGGLTSTEYYYGTRWWGQTFTTPGNAFKLTSIMIKGKKVGSPGIITVGIRDDQNNEVLTNSYNGNLFSTGGSIQEVNLESYNLIMEPNKQYAIVVRDPDGLNDHRIKPMYDNTNPYTGGNAKSSLDSGNTWVDSPSDDFYFEVWGITDFSTATTKFRTSNNAYPTNYHTDYIAINLNCGKSDMAKYWFEVNGGVPSSLDGCAYFGTPVLYNLPGKVFAGCSTPTNLYYDQGIYYACCDDVNGYGGYKGYTNSGATVTYMSINENNELLCFSSYLDFIGYKDSYLTAGYFESFIASANDWIITL